MPQACEKLADTWVQAADPTWVGVSRIVRSPSPSCPWELSPQQNSALASSMPHEVSPPATSEGQAPEWATPVGAVRLTVSPCPS